ncbi:hypothetical protein [Streptomyces sp. NPDC097610]
MAAPVRRLPVHLRHQLVADKTRYQLTFDPAEQTAPAERLALCPDQPI